MPPCPGRSDTSGTGTVRAKVFARRGDLEAAELLSREAVAHAMDSDFLVARADALSDRAEVLLLAGREAEAADASESAIGVHTLKGNLLLADALREKLAGLR